MAYNSTGPQAVPDQPITAPYFAHGIYHCKTANGPCVRTVNIIIGPDRCQFSRVSRQQLVPINAHQAELQQAGGSIITSTAFRLTVSVRLLRPGRRTNRRVNVMCVETGTVYCAGCTRPS